MSSVVKPGRGRPSFVPSETQQVLVERMASCGDTWETIAGALDIDRDTLSKHFPRELTRGRCLGRAIFATALYELVAKGNVTAVKHLDDVSRAARAAEQVLEQPVPLRAIKLGKKEQALIDARSAGGGDWGDDLRSAVVGRSDLSADQHKTPRQH